MRTTLGTTSDDFSLSFKYNNEVEKNNPHQDQVDLKKT